jgi:hypothetical protein
MTTDKKKIVFAGVLLLVVGFMVAYGFWAYGGDPAKDEVLKEVKVPELGEELPKYENRLEAVNAMKEVRESNAPSIYDEALLDSTGLYDADLPEMDKQRLLDSLFSSESLQDFTESFDFEVEPSPDTLTAGITTKTPQIQSVTAKELALEHQLFFASHTTISPVPAASTDNAIPVVVSGTQTIRVNDRLKLRTVAEVAWNGVRIPAHSLMYGQVKFQPNRVLLEVALLNGQPATLTAFDVLDGREGIFIKNSFQQQASDQVINDAVQDIEIPAVPGMPQLRGLKNVFRRSYRRVRVTIYDNYQLLLKSKK